MTQKKALCHVTAFRHGYRLHFGCTPRTWSPSVPVEGKPLDCKDCIEEKKGAKKKRKGCREESVPLVPFALLPFVCVESYDGSTNRSP